MMELLEIEGVYRDGKVELDELPEGVKEARVRVVFLPDEEQKRREHAEPTVASEPARSAAIKRLLARMEKGINFGGPPYPRREELYDRLNRYPRRDG